MEQLGKALALGGLLLLVLGGVLFLLGRSGFRGLPGDIRYETESVKIYFPLASSIAVSVLLTLAVWAWNWFTRR